MTDNTHRDKIREIASELVRHCDMTPPGERVDVKWLMQRTTELQAEILAGELAEQIESSNA